MKIFEIWQEGFLIQGMGGQSTRASYIGRFKADTFQEACVKAFGENEYFSPEHLTFWGCKLYDNEEEARKAFG